MHNGFAYHNWWHLALFHIDGCDHAAALAIYDEVLAGAHGMALSRLDATAMLWRLRLEGVDVGARFEAVADAWQADLDAEGGFYAFNDFHAALAFAATGRDTQAAEWLATMRDGAIRFGGSHAQRDLATLTLIEAARLAGRGKLARHYLGERLVHKPGGAWGVRLAQRIAANATPARKDSGTLPTHRVQSREPLRSLA